MLFIGFITYNDTTARYLPYFLESLKKQTFKDFVVAAADNSDQELNENSSFINKHHADVELYWMGRNMGFARAYNLLIEKAIAAGAEYFLALNPDTILDEQTIEKLQIAMEEDKVLGSASPKVYSWDFENNKKENIIDTCGIVRYSALRFMDLGQGKIDAGQFDDARIVGPSGAAGIYRITALQEVKDKYGYFDSRMFMYKEDCDLAYRLEKAGFRARLVPDAHIFHDRTAKKRSKYIWNLLKERRGRNRNINKWSFVNQQLIFSKHWDEQSFKAKFKIIWYQFQLFVYLFFFEAYLLKYFFARNIKK